MSIVRYKPDEPDIVEKIIRDVADFQGYSANMNEFFAPWQRYLQKLKREIPRIKIEDDGDTVRLGPISQGCRLCKQGRWDCIFCTMTCNLNCRFCSSPGNFQIKNFFSAFGHSLADIIENYPKGGIKGISFTGGEPFIEFDTMKTWLKKLKASFPSNYFWVYTNGLLLQKKQIDWLAGHGLNEMRFNLAATGYTHPQVLAILAYAAKKNQVVTVEIPLIPREAKKLLDSLEIWAEHGVTHLNLHELMREPGSPSASLEGVFQTLVTEDGHRTDISSESKTVFLQVAKKVQQKKLPLNLNLCSIKNKLRQIKGRRASLAILVKKPYEKTGENGCLETILAIDERRQPFFVHPDVFEEIKKSDTGCRFFRLLRLGPLSVYHPGSYLSMAEVD